MFNDVKGQHQIESHEPRKELQLNSSAPFRAGFSLVDPEAPEHCLDTNELYSVVCWTGERRSSIVMLVMRMNIMSVHMAKD